MKYPKISVIMPTYCRPEFLPEAVDSVLNQTFRDFEILVIDDGSFTAKDALKEQAKTATEQGIRLAVLEMEENSGFHSAPTNIGVRHALGSYIARADDDDIWDPDHLEVLLEVMLKNRADITYSCWRISNTGDAGPPDGMEWEYIPFNWNTAHLILKDPRLNFISSQTLWSKASVVGFLGSSPFNEEIRKFGDWEFYVRCITAGLKIKGTDKITFTYRWGHPQIQTGRKTHDLTAGVVSPGLVKQAMPKWGGLEEVVS